jgi:hypothetical protein
MAMGSSRLPCHEGGTSCVCASALGSREALLNEALIQANVEWGAEVDAAIAAGAGHGESPAERFERIWSRMLDSLAAHRGLWAANLEAFSQTDQTPQVRAQLTAALTQARPGLVIGAV